MVDTKTAKAKIAPHSKESEMMVLGCMLMRDEWLNISVDALKEEDFYYPEHKLIFSVMVTLFRRESPVDVHLVAEEAKRIGKLEDAGGVGYIMVLSQYAGTYVQLDEYVKIVKGKATLRQMISASHKIEKSAFEEPQDVAGALDNAQSLFFAISQNAHMKSGIQIADIISGEYSKSGLSYLKELENRQAGFLDNVGKPFVGIPTGFSGLDKIINGLSPSNLVICAGRPGMGKSALLLNVLENVALREGLPAAIFSLEMSAEQILHRMVCSQAEVESSKIERGSLSGAEYQRIVNTTNKMRNSNIIIDDQPGMRISDLRSRARRIKEIYGIKLLIIDYLQLLYGSSNHYSHDNRQGEISEISRMLKFIARELDIPVLCGSQLSRRVEERKDHRPLLSDLRESGTIEQDADQVILLLRFEYYDPEIRPGVAEIIVGKNRHGTTGNIELAYVKPFAKFANMDTKVGV